ncbi:MAG: preprotein translocase subunit SecE [Phycisphaerales bacterium]|nr:preprotein translocase subunit SecE [Phycisphaerales bacterium]
MAGAIYKPEQGYWTRVMSSVAVGVIGLAGAVWIYDQLTGANIYLRGGLAAGFLIAAAALVYWVYGVNRKTVDFFIATEGELKKVNWTTRREIIGSTWVVVIVAVSIAAILFVVDIFFKELFSAIGILTGGSYFVDLFKSLFG